MAQFLSAEWLAEMDAAARANPSLQAATTGRRLVLQYLVTGGPPGTLDGYLLVLDQGTAAVVAGRDEGADVTFTCPYDVAEGIAQGRLSAQTAFMTGQLRVGGNTSALLEHRAALEAVDDVFSAARAGSKG